MTSQLLLEGKAGLFLRFSALYLNNNHRYQIDIINTILFIRIEEDVKMKLKYREILFLIGAVMLINITDCLECWRGLSFSSNANIYLKVKCKYQKDACATIYINSIKVVRKCVPKSYFNTLVYHGYKFDSCNGDFCNNPCCCNKDYAYCNCNKEGPSSNVKHGLTVRCTIGNTTVDQGQSHTYTANCAKHTCVCDPKLDIDKRCTSTMIGCLDSATSKCYSIGQVAVNKDMGDGQTGNCTCQGSESAGFIFSCKTDDCTDSKGNKIKKGALGKVMIGAEEYTCECGGALGFIKCVSPNCIDKNGQTVSKGMRYDVDFGGTAYNCECNGNNSGINCTI